MRYELIKRRRMMKKSQSEMASLLGLTRVTYATLEGGKMDPRLSHIETLLKLFGMDEKEVADLMRNE